MPAFDTSIAVSSNQSSPGQPVDFDGPVAGAITLTNTSPVSVQYATDSVTWVTVASAGAATFSAPDPTLFRIRKAVSDSYPVAVRFQWQQSSGQERTIIVSNSRSLSSLDDGAVLECTATVTITIPIELDANFACVVIPSGTTSVASSGGALLNGATTTLTRTAAANAMFAIQARASASDSYVISGA